MSLKLKNPTMGFVERNPGLWLHILPLAVGMACLGQFFNYGLALCFPIDSGTKCRLGISLSISIIIGFPILVLPILITAHIKRAELYESIMNPLFDGIAIILYLITGSLGIYMAILMPEKSEARSRQFLVSLLCLFCGLLYLPSLVFWILKQRQGGAFVEPPESTVVVSGAV